MIDRYLNSFPMKEDYYNRGGKFDWHIGSNVHALDKLTTLLCLIRRYEASGLEIDFYLDYSLKLRSKREPEKSMNPHPKAK